MISTKLAWDMAGSRKQSPMGSARPLIPLPTGDQIKSSSLSWPPVHQNKETWPLLSWDCHLMSGSDLAPDPIGEARSDRSRCPTFRDVLEGTLVAEVEWYDLLLLTSCQKKGSRMARARISNPTVTTSLPLRRACRTGWSLTLLHPSRAQHGSYRRLGPWIGPYTVVRMNKRRMEGEKHVLAKRLP